MDLRRRWAVLLAAPILAAGLTTASATVASATTAGSAHTQFELTRWGDPSPTPADHTVSLSCLPPGGSHPDAAAACADIREAGGDFGDLPGDPGIDVCPAVYNPVTVTAAGTFHGQPIHYRETFQNACVLHRETGPVFQF